MLPLQLARPICQADLPSRQNRLRHTSGIGSRIARATLSRKAGPAYAGPASFRATAELALELALGGDALFLGHLRKPLALARIQALAGMIAALAGALALTGVCADAMAVS